MVLAHGCTFFCPEQGKVVDEGPSPATLAGEAGGDARRRVLLAAGAAGVIWAVYAGFAALRGRFDATVAVATALVIVASVGLAAFAKRSRTTEGLAAGGALYLMATSFAVAWVEQHLGLGGGQVGVSWNAVWVAFVPLLVPCSPRRTFVKAMMAATMTPAAIVLHVALTGRGWPSLLDFVAVVLPVYLGGFLAFAAAKVLSQIGGELERYRNVGRYELVRRLGEGGMGEVWEARHRQLARPAAVKLVRHREREDSVRNERFEREARVTASLQSPHTVQLFDYGVTEEGELFYVMELLQGMDLEELVKAHGPLPAARVVHILRQALDSLQEAHARGLVHRDIKPGNLFLARYGLRFDHVKVVDFGLVKTDDRRLAVRQDLSTDERISGTPAYLAPEVVTAGEVDGRADIYALGCVAYYLLTGRRVVEEESPLAAAVAHVTEDPIPFKDMGVDVPEDVAEVILACLEKDPVRRPDAWTLADLLDRVAVPSWTQHEAKAWWTETGSLPPPPVEPLKAPHADAWAGAAAGRA
ncbi:MAG: serine/threonine-protein kinase [Sandaracinaceae bacterium]